MSPKSPTAQFIWRQLHLTAWQRWVKWGAVGPIKHLLLQSVCFNASYLFSFSPQHQVPDFLSLQHSFPFLPSWILTRSSFRLLSLFASFASFDFSHSQLLKPNRKKWFPPSFPHYLCFSLLCLSSPPLAQHPLCCWFDNSLSQVFNGCTESAGCPSRAEDLTVAGRQEHAMTTAFAGKWRNTHLRRERDRDTYIAAKRESSTSLFHLSFDWTVIVMCGPHCNPGKGRGINKWCNYKRLMWHKGREAGQEKASGGLSADVIRLTFFCRICCASLTGIRTDTDLNSSLSDIQTDMQAGKRSIDLSLWQRVKEVRQRGQKGQVLSGKTTSVNRTTWRTFKSSCCTLHQHCSSAYFMDSLSVVNGM